METQGSSSESVLGPQLLTRWMATHDVSPRDFGERIGVTANAVCGYLAGRFRPALFQALLIQKVTDGEVPQSSWLTSEEFRLLTGTQSWKEIDHG
jgi:hypothetical protein